VAKLYVVGIGNNGDDCIVMMTSYRLLTSAMSLSAAVWLSDDLV